MLIPGDSRPPEIEWWPTMLRNTYTRGATAPVTAMGRLNNVSIHAPTRGATCLKICPRASTWFQSTHPHGVRLGATRQNKEVDRGFNPRTHTGCDTECGYKTLLGLWFQSTHPHGVRPLLLLIRPGGFPVSIHAPTRGATNVHFFQHIA